MELSRGLLIPNVGLTGEAHNHCFVVGIILHVPCLRTLPYEFLEQIKPELIEA